MEGKMNGKIVLVTGGSSGIGLATAKGFHEKGAHVILAGRNLASLEDAAASFSGRVTIVECDVTSLEEIRKMAAEIRREFSGIDTLVVNAGIARFFPFDRTKETVFDQLFDTNVKGAYFTIQEVAPLLPEGGSIVVNASALHARGMEGASVYSATKAALRSLVRTLAVELEARKIRINAVSPGPIQTPIFGKLGMDGPTLETMASSILAKVPMGRFGTPEEIGRAILFLASEEASFMTGSDLMVDGGMAQV